MMSFSIIRLNLWLKIINNCFQSLGLKHCCTYLIEGLIILVRVSISYIFSKVNSDVNIHSEIDRSESSMFRLVRD